MTQKEKKQERIDYLTMFKKSLAMSFSLFLFGNQASYSDSVITPNTEHGFGTVVTNNGNGVYEISGGKTQGSATFHNFSNFKVDTGDTANLRILDPSGKYINLVDNQIVIKGIFNSLNGAGAVTGNVVFVSPNGMLVDSTGIMNVGSLQLITPTNDAYKAVRGIGGDAISITDIDKLKSDSFESNTQLLGKIFAGQKIDIADGQKIIVGDNADIVSGFIQSGFANTMNGDLSKIVRTDGVIDASQMTGNSGNISLHSIKIEPENYGGLIQSTGDITLSTPTDDKASVIATSAILKANGNINIGSTNADKTSSTNGVYINNNISANGAININAYELNINADLDANSSKIQVNTKNSINGNITTANGLNIKSGGATVQGDSSVIENTGAGTISIDAGRIEQNQNAVIKNSGNGSINILAAGLIEQNEGAVITNEGTGDVYLNAPDDYVLQRINANNGDITVIGKDLVLNDTISAQNGNITINSSKITQEGSGYTLFETAGHLDIATQGNIGSSSNAIIISTGSVSLDSGYANGEAHIKGVGDKDVNIVVAKNLKSLNVDSDNSITIEKSITATRDIDLTAQKSITQSEGALLRSTNGGVTLTAADGDIGSAEQRVIAQAKTGISATASKGVNIEGNNTSIDLVNDVHAGTDINIGTTGSGTIIIRGDVINENGNVELSTDKALDIDYNIKAGGSVTLTSGVHIYQADGKIIEGGLDRAKNGVVDITNKGNGGIKLSEVVSHSGGVNIRNATDSGGNITTGTINAKLSSLTVYNEANEGKIDINGKLETPYEIIIEASGDITQSYTDSVALNSGKSIKLSSFGGDIGNHSQSITLNAPEGVSATIASDNSVYLESPGMDFVVNKITAEDGSVNLKTSNTADSSNNNVILKDSITAQDVNITAEGSILQQTEDVDTKTISASKTLTLTAKTGDIGSDTNKIVFSSENSGLTATSNGSVHLNGVETDITTEKITYSGNLDISTTTSGDIIIGKEEIVDGSVELNSAENLVLTKTITATDNITVKAKKDVLQSEELNGTALKSGKDISITAKNAGSAEKNIIVDATGKLNIGEAGNYAGNIYVEDNTGDLVIGQLFANENLSVKAMGDIVQADNSVNSINARGNVSLESAEGDIGSVTNALKVDISGTDAKFNVNKAGNVYLSSSSGNLNLGDITAENTVDVLTNVGGDINLKGLIKSKDVSLTSAKNIWQDVAIEKSIEAENITLVSQEGSIGSLVGSGRPIKSIGFSLTSDDGVLSVDANQSAALNGINTNIKTGDINVNNSLELSTTGTGRIAVTKDIDVGGYIKIDAAQEMSIDGNISAGDTITLKASGGLVQSADKTITTSTSLINIGDGHLVIENTNGGNVVINNATAQKGDVTIKNIVSADGTSTGDMTVGNITSDTGKVVISNTNVSGDVNLDAKITSAQTVEISSSGNIYQADTNANTAIDAQDTITFNAQNNIGKADKNIQVSTTKKITAIAGNEENNQIGGIYLTNENNDFITGTISATGDVKIDVTGSNKNIEITNTIKGNNIDLHATGSVIQNLEDATLDRSIAAKDSLKLTADSGNLGEAGNAIDFSANGDLIASANNGSVVLNGIDTNISTKDINAKYDIDLATQNSGQIDVSDKIETAEGYIRLDAASKLNIGHDLSAGKHITLNANGGINQTAGSIISGTNSSISTGEGNISITNNQGGSLIIQNATAQKGDLIVENKDKDVSGLVDSSLITGNLSVNDGKIELKSASLVELQGDISAGKTVDIIANGGITQDLDASITSGTIAGIDFGDGNVTITNNNGGSVQILDINANKGDIQITSNAPVPLPGGITGEMSLGTLTANQGKILVANNVENSDIILGGTLNAIGEVNVSSSGNITQAESNTDVAIDTNNNIVLNSENGSIGTSITKPLKLNADGSVFADGANVHIASDGQDLNIANLNTQRGEDRGSVSIATLNSGDVKINSTIIGQDIEIDSADDIFKSASIEKAVDSTGDLTLKAQGNIGSKDAIDGGTFTFTNNGSLDANAGKAVILNGIDTNINTNSITAGTDIDIKTTIVADATKGNITVNDNINATNGSVKLDSAKGLDINKDILSAKEIVLNANDGNIDITSTVNAGSYLTIDANGNISQTSGQLQAHQSDASGNAIMVSSNGGSITLSSAIADGGTINVIANQVVDGATKKAGDINLGNLSTTNKNITIQNKGENKAIILNGTLSAGTADVNITSEGGINQTTLDTTAIIANNVILDANTDIGSDVKTLLVDADGSVKAHAKNINLGSKNKDLNIAGINNGLDAGVPLPADKVVIKTESGKINILDTIKATNIEINSAKNIEQSSTLTKSLDGQNISLNASNGGIGSSSANALDVVIAENGRLDATSLAGDIYLNSPEGDFYAGDITANGHKVDIDASEGLSLKGLITSKDVNLLAVNDITQDAGLSKSIIAENIALKSTSGNIGTPMDATNPAIAIGISLTDASGSLSASGNSVVLKGIDTTINTGSITATQDIDISTEGEGSSIKISENLSAGGYINLDSAEDIEVDKTLNAVKHVNVSGKDVLLNSIITAGTSIKIDAENSVTQAIGSNDTVLNANTTIDITAGEDIGLSSKSILLNANDNVSATGKNIFLQSPQKNLSLGNITSTNNGTINIATSNPTIDQGHIKLDGLVKGGDITIDAAKGLTQTTTGKSIEASGKLVLHGRDGDIGVSSTPPTPAQAIEFSANEVEAHAKGSVVLNGTDTDIFTSNIEATKNIDLTTTGSGNITISSEELKTEDGYINLNVADDLIINNKVTSKNSSVTLGTTVGDIKLNAVVNAATDLNVNSANDIVQQLDGTALNATGDINLSAGNLAGAENKNLLVNAGGSVNLDSAKKAYLEDNTDDFKIGTITATDYLKITADKKIIQDADGTGVGATVADLISKTSDIGENANAIKIHGVGTINADAQQGSVYFTGNTVNTGSVKAQDIAQIDSSDYVNLNGLISAKDVVITATNDITQNSALDKSISAKNITLNSSSGNIGTPVSNGNVANAIDFTITEPGGILSASGKSVVLNGVDTDISIGSINATENIDLSTTGDGGITIADDDAVTAGGYVSLNSAKQLDINNNINAGKFITLNANGGIVQVDGIQLTSGLNATQNGEGNITITNQNGGDVIINQASATKGDISITNNTVASGENGIVEIGDIVANDGNITVNSASTLEMKDNLSAGKNIVLNSVGGFTQTNGIMNAGTNPSTTIGNGNITVTNGINGDILVNNAISNNGDIVISNNTAVGEEGVVEVGNLTANDGDVVLNSSSTIKITNNITAGENIELYSIGGVNQENGNLLAGNKASTVSGNGSISVINGDGGSINIQNATAKKGDVLIINVPVPTGQPVTGGEITVGSITSETGKVEIQNGIENQNIVLNSQIDAKTSISLETTGDIKVSETYNDISLKTDGGILLEANDIGNEEKALKVNAKGVVDADGNKIYLTSPNADLKTGTITAEQEAIIKTTGSGSITMNGTLNAKNTIIEAVDNLTTNIIDVEKDAILKTTGTGSITMNGNLTAESTNINSNADLNINKNIEVTNGVEISAEKGIEQNTASSITTNGGVFTVNAKDGNLSLNGTLKNNNGAISVTNSSTGNNNLTINNISASEKFDIINKANGLLSVTGTVENNGESTIISENAGIDSGVSISGNIDNNDKLTITAKGKQGTNISGDINNSLNPNSEINITNEQGSLSVTSNSIKNSANNKLLLTNNGDGGTSIDANIDNSGILSVTNNAGIINFAGSLNAEYGSENTFNQGGNADFVINSEIHNKGNELTFENSGTGDLILGENAFITVYSVNDNGTIYTGQLNLLKSGSTGNITIDGKISDFYVVDSPLGKINIINNATGTDSSIVFGDNSSIETQNFAVEIKNNGGGEISIGNGTKITTQDLLNIINLGSGGIKAKENSILNAAILNIDNQSTIGGISFVGNNELKSTSDLSIKNSGKDGIIFGNNTVLSGTTIDVENTGENGIVIGTDANIKGSTQITNTGKSGIVIGDNAEFDGDTKITNEGNDGIAFGENTSITGNADIQNNGGNSLTFGDTTTILGSANIINAGENGLYFGNDTTINNGATITNNGNGTLHFGDNTDITGNAEITNEGDGGISFGENTSITGNADIQNNGGNSLTFGDTTTILGSANIINAGENGLYFGNDTTINNGATITNNGNGTLHFGDNTDITGNAEITNEGDGGISFGENTSITGNADIQNNGGNSLTFGNTTTITGTANITNVGNNGLTFGNDTTIGNSTTISNTGNGALKFGERTTLTGENIAIESKAGLDLNNNANLNATGSITLSNSNSGAFNLGENSSLAAGSNMTIINNSTAGNLNIDETNTLTVGNKFLLQNKAINGLNIDGVISGNDINIQNANGNVLIAHNHIDGNILATNSISINTDNGDILNSATDNTYTNNKGLVAGDGGVKLSANKGSIGVLDSTLNNIIQDGFNLDANNAIHVNTQGSINATAKEDINILSSDSNLNIDTLSSKNALLTAINGELNIGTAKTDNLYLYAKGNNASINVSKLASLNSAPVNLTTEADLSTTINSDSALNIDSMLSNTGSIEINSQGNVDINEIAAPENITVNVEDEKLSITNLGKVERNTAIIPKTVSLTVKDAKRPPTGASYKDGMTYEEINTVQPNSKLDIYHGYIQDKVTLKADTISAQVYDISDSSVAGQKRVDANGNEATGFHNANKDGKLLEFDIQGANYAQKNVGSATENEFYNPSANDKHALNVHITIGDSVDGAEYGANFKKLYSNYASVDTVGSDTTQYSTLMFEDLIIGDEAVFRNNKIRLDIDNNPIEQFLPINKHYNDTPNMTIDNETSFNSKITDVIEMELKPEPEPEPIIPPVNPPITPDEVKEEIDKNDPQKIVKVPTYDSITKEPTVNNNENSAVDDAVNIEEISKSEDDDSSSAERKGKDAAAWRNINWVVRNSSNVVLGDSTQKQYPVVKSLVSINKKGIVVKVDKKSGIELKKGDNLFVYMQQDVKDFDAQGVISNISGSHVKIKFINMDKATENILLFWCMQRDNL